MEVSITNAGPEPATLHVLPQLWFRNTWSWDVGAERPSLRATAADRVAVDHPVFGELSWELDAGPDGALPEVLFCENDTNLARLYGSDASPAYPKDGINDHVVAGAPTVNPAREGTKCGGVVPPHGGTGRDAGGAGPPALAVVVARLRHRVRRGARDAAR